MGCATCLHVDHWSLPSGSASSRTLRRKGSFSKTKSPTTNERGCSAAADIKALYALVEEGAVSFAIIQFLSSFFSAIFVVAGNLMMMAVALFELQPEFHIVERVPKELSRSRRTWLFLCIFVVALMALKSSEAFRLTEINSLRRLRSGSPNFTANWYLAYIHNPYRNSLETKMSLIVFSECCFELFG
jgi:hypothetical protein